MMVRIFSPEKTEFGVAASLAAVGALQGAFKYYVAPELTSHRVTGLIALPVAVMAVRMVASSHSQ